MAKRKWIGAALGWILSGGNILGALAGYCIGSLLADAAKGADGKVNNSGYDEESSAENYGETSFEEMRNSFLFSLLVLSSYVIKADSKVMHSEMEYVRKFLRYNFGDEAVLQGEIILKRLFKKMDNEGMLAFKNVIHRSCMEISFNMSEEQRLQLLDYLIMIAKADGTVSFQEVEVLKDIALHLHLSVQDVESMLNMGYSYEGKQKYSSSKADLNVYYKILGISPSATDKEVKDAYRKMALRHHPDRVASLGEDIRKAAEAKFQEINAAKEAIYKARNI